jgi:ankyrin repeat protein
MRAKYIYEALEDILKPKSEEEILSHLGGLSPENLLIMSSKIGFLPGVKLALKNGANVHAKNDYALRWASGNGHKDVVELLLKNGVNVHADNDDALRWASANGHKDVVELLLKNGADVHANNDEARRWAANNGHKDVVELLKKYM